MLSFFKCILLTLVFLLQAQVTSASASFLKKDSISVYIFLHEDCIISQYYTLTLKELHDEYASADITFIGLFPNFSSKPEKISAFKEKYNIPFELKTDFFHKKKEAFAATVTPEVVLFNENTQTILYRGRIDNAYAGIGKKRRFVSSHELQEALEAVKNKRSISIKETKAVGCFINKKKLNFN